MSLSKYLLIMFLSAILGWVGWILVVTNISPQEVGWWGFLFFYISLFLAIMGSLAVIGYYIRVFFFRDGVRFRQASIAFRQAFSLSVLLIIALWLSSHDLLSWWNILLLIIGVSLFEFFFISYQKS